MGGGHTYKRRRGGILSYFVQSITIDRSDDMLVLHACAPYVGMSRILDVKDFL